MNILKSSIAIITVIFVLSLYILVPFSNSKITKSHEFQLVDNNENIVSLSDYSDKIVVLEWLNPDCPFVQRHYKEKTMKGLSEKYKDKEIVWLAINSTHYMNIKDNADWADKFGISYPILDDHKGDIGKLYGAKTTPHIYIVDNAEKKVNYQGAIDDDPRGSKDPSERVNYVDTALAELASNEDVTVTETKPYGCSVKYSK